MTNDKHVNTHVLAMYYIKPGQKYSSFTHQYLGQIANITYHKLSVNRPTQSLIYTNVSKL